MIKRFILASCAAIALGIAAPYIQADRTVSRFAAALQRGLNRKVDIGAGSLQSLQRSGIHD